MLCAPAWADDEPQPEPMPPQQGKVVPSVSIDPPTFTPGDGDVTITVTGCDTEPETKRNQIFDETPSFDADDDVWTAVAGTKDTLKAGKRYVTSFTCETEGKATEFTFATTIPKKPAETFKFGFDKVELSTRTIKAGGTLGFEVTCPTTVSAKSASFVSAPTFERDTSEDKVAKGTATFKSTLPSVVTIKVYCKDHGFVTYSTKPGQKSVGDGAPKVPKGAPQTGDGSMAGRDGDSAPGPALLAGAGLVGLAGVALRRRAGRRESV
jgi:hypothetical protein